MYMLSYTETVKALQHNSFDVFAFLREKLAKFTFLRTENGKNSGCGSYG